MKDVISVLIPVYNTSAYLRECLNSILNQSYPHTQIVIVDDGSTDNSLSIAREYESKHQQVEVYHQENMGVATARNNLLSKVKGDYTIFVDSDDWIEPRALEFLLKTLKKNKADIAYCSKVTKEQNHISIEESWTYEKLVYEFLCHKRIDGSLCNKLIRSDLLTGKQFHTSVFYGEDALFFWQILKSKVKIVITNEQLYHYRSNPLSLSRQTWSPDRKGTCHIVWTSICEDVARDWPQYLYIAQARLALENMFGLYFAAKSGYKYDQHIKLRQECIRAYLPQIRKSQLASPTHYICACILSRCYFLGKLIAMIK
ncbi:MAG: glycosyltransferase family 2 protein [Rikenellaceae bacterium]